MTPRAEKTLLGIKDTRIREQIRKRIRVLANYPDQQGKALGDDLFDFRSVRAVKERYRIIYKIEKEKIIVLIVLVGIRKEGDKKDVYAVAKKLARLGLLDLVMPTASSADLKVEDQPQTTSSPEMTGE